MKPLNRQAIHLFKGENDYISGGSRNLSTGVRAPSAVYLIVLRVENEILIVIIAC